MFINGVWVPPPPKDLGSSGNDPVALWFCIIILIGVVLLYLLTLTER